MALTTTALSSEQMRGIIRENPALFAAMASAGAADAEDIASAVTQLLLSNPAVVDAVAAAGLGLPPEGAAKLGLLKWVAVADILAKTANAHRPESLAALFFEELQQLCIGGGAIQ